MESGAFYYGDSEWNGAGTAAAGVKDIQIWPTGKTTNFREMLDYAIELLTWTWSNIRGRSCPAFTIQMKNREPRGIAKTFLKATDELHPSENLERDKPVKSFMGFCTIWYRDALRASYNFHQVRTAPICLKQLGGYFKILCRKMTLLGTILQ